MGLVASLLLGGGSALAAPVPDQVNVPGLNSSLREVPVGPASFFTSVKQQTFTAAQTGDLVGIWIAAACTGCGAEPNSFVNVHVSTSTQDVLLDPPLSTWAGGNSGNLQYVPLTNAVHVNAGDTVRLTFGCSPASPGCLSSFSLVATGNQYGGGQLAEVSNTGVTTPLNADLVLISEMDNIIVGQPAQSSQPQPQPQPHTTTTINDTDAALQYSGAWGYYPGRPASFQDLQNDVHATLNDGDAVSYTFTGTGIAYVSEKSDGYGLVDVYVDGKFQATVDANAAGVHNLGNQVLFSKTDLAAGQHTLKLVKRSGVYMLLDDLVVTS
ncbi:MAG: hypothetical protein JO057_04475 [Chloroflexi bacterium]|nr:hypothetical protein [Chloroflexota bacterium]